jgi:hypothetical protein
MPPPQGPMAIPPAAFAALSSLRAAFGDVLPEGTEFGIGVKRTAGAFLDQLALTVFVPEKLPAEQVPLAQLIPPTWEAQGLEFRTDVVQSNPKPIGLVNDTSFHPTLHGGIEIGSREQVDSVLVRDHEGTLGCMVQRRSDGSRLLLTANHVAPGVGTTVFQPRQDRPQASVIGTVVRAVPHLAAPFHDCSLIEPNGTRGLDSAVKEVGPVRGSAPVVEPFSVAKKRGRSTGLTSGVVAAVVPAANSFTINRIVLATFPFGGLFCFHGDSGAVVLNGRDEVIGLLVQMDEEVLDAAGQPIASVGVAKPIRTILDALEVEVAVSPPVVNQVQPDTAVGALAHGGVVQLDGWGFDPGSRVTFGGVPALGVAFASPRDLLVTPPVQFLFGQAVDVIVTNGLGAQSSPNPAARFTY